MDKTSFSSVAEIPFSLRAACEEIGLAIQDLTGMIYDRMKKRGDEVSDSVRETINNILGHSSVEDNRFWASGTTLAMESVGRGMEGGLSPSTVDLAMAKLKYYETIRPLSGDELHAGRGAHTATERGIKRRGRLPVGHWDIGGFFFLLPGKLQRDLSKAAKEVQRKNDENKRIREESKRIAEANGQVQSFLETMVDAPGKDRVNPVYNPSLPTPTRQDKGTRDQGVGPPGRAVSSVGIGIATDQPPTESYRTQTTTNQEPPPQPTSGQGVPSPKNRGQNRSRGEKKKVCSDGRTEAEVLASFGKRELFAVAALQELGLTTIRKAGERDLWVPVPVDIVLTMGHVWALELVEFYFWERRQGKVMNPGLLVGVWKNWLRGDGAWSSKFEKELDTAGRARHYGSTERIKARIAFMDKRDVERRNATDADKGGDNSVVPDTKVATAPVAGQLGAKKEGSAPVPVENPSSIRNDWSPDEVPEADCAELLRQAMEAVLKQRIYNTEASRERVRRLGFAHAGVKIEAQRVLRERSQGGPGASAEVKDRGGG